MKDSERMKFQDGEGKHPLDEEEKRTAQPKYARLAGKHQDPL